MNETYWEQAKKAHKKRLLVIVIVALFVLITSGIIISNNRDIIKSPNETTQESAAVDSSLFVFGMEDSAETENLIDNTDTSPAMSIATHNAKKSVALETSIDTVVGPATMTIASEKNINKIKDPVAKKGNNSISYAQSEERKPVIKDENNEKIDKKLNNIDSLRQYSILLPIIRSGVIDRKDIIISLALELFYSDSTDNRELLLKGDALKVVAIKLIQLKELNSIQKDALSEELKNEMNLIFDRKTLLKVIIREFHIEKVAAQ
jgi:hypothetical protein